MKVTTTHIVAAIVCAVGAIGLYARMNTPDTASHKVSEVKHQDRVKAYTDWLDKHDGRGKE